MDAPSIRPALKDMASRLATAGYYVHAAVPLLPRRALPRVRMSDEDMHARRELMGTVTPTNIVGDAEALLAVADADPAARDGAVGAIGFCMSGGLAVSWPGRCPNASPLRPRSTAPGSCATALTHRTSAWTGSRPSSTSPGPTTTDRPIQNAHQADPLKPPGSRHRIDVLTEAVHGFAPAGGRDDRTASSSTGSGSLPPPRRNL